MTAAIDFKTREGQQFANDAYRLCFPEDEKTPESMELRRMYDNAVTRMVL